LSASHQTDVILDVVGAVGTYSPGIPSLAKTSHLEYKSAATPPAATAAKSAYLDSGIREDARICFSELIYTAILLGSFNSTFA
jgi:hypothetical protein